MVFCSETCREAYTKADLGVSPVSDEALLGGYQNPYATGLLLWAHPLVAVLYSWLH